MFRAVNAIMYVYQVRGILCLKHERSLKNACFKKPYATSEYTCLCFQNLSKSIDLLPHFRHIKDIVYWQEGLRVCHAAILKEILDRSNGQ